MRKWLERYSIWLGAIALLLAIDFGFSSLASCVGGEQQQAEQCAKEYYGFSKAISVGFLGWLIDSIRTEYNLVTAVSTIVIAVFTITLWRATTGLLKAAHEQSLIGRRSARAAYDAAKAAEHQVQVASLIAERQLRAYVSKTKGEIRDFEIGKAPQAHVLIKNSGQTPAYDVTTWIGIAIVPDVIPGRPSQPPMPHQPSRAVLGPGQDNHLTVRPDFPLTPVHMNDFIAGTSLIAVAGGITYRDVFGHNRTATFSVYYGGRYGLNTNHQMMNGPEGNEAD